VATFEYTAIGPSGQEVRGTIVCSGRPAAIEQVAALGLHPVVVEERTDARPVPRIGSLLVRGRVSQASVEAFIRELANLLSGGVPLSKALALLADEASQPAARAQWAAIRDDVANGSSLADALARWPRSFPAVYVAMVRAGETGGFLELVLEQIAEFRAREQELKNKVKSAMIYPIVLAVLASAVLTFLLTYFIPRFSAIFAEFGGALPWLTRAIVGASRAVIRYGWAMLIAIALAMVGLRRVMASDAGRRNFERLLLRTPWIGTVVARFALVRFCRMLGTLLGAGVPLVLGLRVAREAIGNQTLADAVTRALDEVQRGAPLARSLATSGTLFPPAVVEMVSVAEESGRLDKELVRIASAYESELDRRLNILVRLAEPALLFVMAAIVGTVVIGMLLPVFTLQELIR